MVEGTWRLVHVVRFSQSRLPGIFGLFFASDFADGAWEL